MVFIFATTEIEAVPATILSRCQEFHFRRVSNNEAVAHLRHICVEEKIEASDAALALLARAGEGSVRDSVALLDQLATFGNGVVDEHEAIRLLGGIDLALFRKVLQAILANDSSGVSHLAREVEENGWDPRTVHAHFLSFCRDALHLALAGGGASGAAASEAVALPVEERTALGQIAAQAGYENLLRLLHHLLGSESAIRRSEAGALALEIAWLRAAELPRLVAIERLLMGVAPERPIPPPRAAPAQATPATPNPARTKPAARPSKREAPATSEPAARATEPRDAADSDAETDFEAGVAKIALGDDAVKRSFVEQLVLRRPTLAALLEDPAALDWNDAERTLVVHPASTFAASSLQRNRELIASAAVAAFGAGVQLRFAAPQERAPAATAAAAATEASAASDPRAAEERKNEAREHPRVQAVLEIFGGEVARVDVPSAPLQDDPGDDPTDPTDDSFSATEDPSR